MKQEHEIADARIVTRLASGVLALAGVWAIAPTVLGLLSGGTVDVLQLAVAVGALYGLYLCGCYALTGRLPLRAKDRGSD